MTSKRIHIDPAWLFRDEAGNTLDPQLFRLLAEIYHHKKLTAASKSAGISYRHSWNLLNKWADFFGTPLVSLEKGRGAYLTALGEKLLWAEQRVSARFQPQMESLASELNIEIQKALVNLTPLLRIQASHGYAVALLPDACTELQLDLQYSSPLEALSALNRDACDLAGFHVPSGIVIKKLLKQYQQLLKPRAHKIIRFITRRQGLMVRQDCPLEINCLEDLTTNGVRFINRQEDSGTRALFDQLLLENTLSSKHIIGYNNREFTHSAVAAYVASNMADAGFGVEQAAHKFGLRFIPICTEDYVFVCHQKSLNKAAMVEFIRTIESNAFHEKIHTLAGYEGKHLGVIEDISHFMPG
ncbi:LysR family transcriptional regulator [Marinomonas sp. 15G1-11]|uniref:LysR family transcriptional regulator n=1 Tax=Marinomonas phaeophyticola TaxID=3004091 RepID=A0ABT4JXZ9_9GAMM|nr:substrate-binding domain-containing protein [Marinomonas sp. 15G1-11]MCZ2722658.1 LysR family transcriptional regulator [Marinomonas sp. 15G1-11]